ncbi:MAG: SMP-30/gluconolactonase/LRE family protein [Planctomycetota bacterium]
MSPFFYRSISLSLFCILIQSTCLVAQQAATPTQFKIEVLDDALLKLIDPDAKIEVLATGFRWSEGPVWRKASQRLQFSDVPNNRIHQWAPNSKLSVFMEPSGFEGDNREKEPGSNGLMEDAQGRLVVCDHGNRRIYRVEQDGSKTTLADRFDGNRFNSPNDLVIHSNGDIYFTDPPYGLRDKTKRELDFNGVYRLQPDGTVTLLTKEFERPNGIALSPDEKTLYVAQSHRPAPVIKSFPIKEDGGIESTGGHVLFNCKKLAETGGKGMPDGMCVDVDGNLWATGPGGVLVISPKGKLLGRVLMGKSTANCAFGEDGMTLFMTSSDRLCRVKTKIKGLGY